MLVITAQEVLKLIMVYSSLAFRYRWNCKGHKKLTTMNLVIFASYCTKWAQYILLWVTLTEFTLLQLVITVLTVFILILLCDACRHAFRKEFYWLHQMRCHFPLEVNFFPWQILYFVMPNDSCMWTSNLMHYYDYFVSLQANLRTKVTHSAQTNLSNLRRDNVSQVYLPK